MVNVVGTDEFEQWFLALEEPDSDAVVRAVEQLAERGVALGFPLSSAIKDSDPPLRELRLQSRGRPIRVFYAFDTRRNAVVIIGGDKTGDDRFYGTMVPRAERIMRAYLAEQAAGDHERLPEED